MKKTLMTMVLVLLVVLLCATIVACDNTDNDQDPQGPNEYEVAKYTVTFNTNGDFVLANPILTDIPAGSKISAPKDKDGNDIIPIKKGYTFQYWSADGTRAFDFANDKINKNTTLTAIYTNNVYRHNVNLEAKLVYNADGTYDIEENAYSQEHATLGAAEWDSETTSIKSTYNGSLSNLACPTVTQAGDSFCFWYYINDEGKPVQFTKWAKSSDTSVAMLSKYAFTNELTLYPMFHSNLPQIEVVYRERDNETVYDRTHSYAIGDDIPAGECISNPTKNGYAFAEWYYIYIDEDENEIEYKFDFAQDGANATSILTAANIKDNFTPGTLRLYARWKRQISLASVADFKIWSDKLNVEDPTKEQLDEINEILGADILVSSIDFQGETLKPFFGNYTFVGTIDGGTYDANNTLTSCAVLSNGIFSGLTSASVFGNIGGVVKNIDFHSIDLQIEQNTNDEFENTVYVGIVASQNGGEIANCDVTGCSIAFDGLHTVIFGAIAAKNSGSNGINTKGYIHDCNVDITFQASCEALTFGGIAGESNASSRLAVNNVNIVVTFATCNDDGVSANGKSTLKMGGIVGVNGGTISRSTVNFVVGALESDKETQFGGAVAVNTGTVGTTKVDVTLCSAQAPALAGASLSQPVCVGGIIGKNEGTLINSHSNANLYVTVTNSTSIVTVGGLVGNNFSDKRDTSTSQTQGIGCITKSYSVGEIVIVTAEGITGVTVYAGGLAGRNSQSKISSNFAIVNISVVNMTADNDGTYNLGFLLGSMEKKSTMVSGWYSNQNTITLNGTVYQDKNFDVLTNGVSTQEDLFGDLAWVLGTAQQKSELGFDDTVWDVVGDGSLPTLK